MNKFLKIKDKKDNTDLLINIDTIEFIVPYINNKNELVSHIKIIGQRDNNYTPVDFDLNAYETESLTDSIDLIY